MIDLRLGDALDWRAGLPSLADSSFDAVITDPPFDARTHRAAVEPKRGARGDRWMAGGDAGALDFAPLDAAAVNLYAAHFARLARRWIVVFTAERQIETWAAALERSGARFVRVGLALRDNPRPQLTGDRPAPPCDFLVIAHALGPLRWNGGGRAGVWRAGASRFDPGAQQHPAQKPLALMRSLVEDFSDLGDLILDPFSGAGTTAVACRELGRRFVGWECDAKYHRVAVGRIARARQQLALDVEPARSEQRELALAEGDLR